MATWTGETKHSTDWVTEIGFLIKEDRGFLLQENGDKIQLEINTDLSITWTGETKNTASWTNQSLS